MDNESTKNAKMEPNIELFELPAECREGKCVHAKQKKKVKFNPI